MLRTRSTGSDDRGPASRRGGAWGAASCALAKNLRLLSRADHQRRNILSGHASSDASFVSVAAQTGDARIVARSDNTRHDQPEPTRWRKFGSRGERSQQLRRRDRIAAGAEDGHALGRDGDSAKETANRISSNQLARIWEPKEGAFTPPPVFNSAGRRRNLPTRLMFKGSDRILPAGVLLAMPRRQ